MKNKINIIIVSIPLILIILMLFNYDYHSNEIELDDFLDRNEIDYGSVDNIISERKDSTAQFGKTKFWPKFMSNQSFHYGTLFG